MKYKYIHVELTIHIHTTIYIASSKLNKLAKSLTHTWNFGFHRTAPQQ